MARERLSDHVGPDILWPSVSVIEASDISPAERKEADERWWQERIRKESGPVMTTFDPAQFEWLKPEHPAARKHRPPSMRISRSNIVIWEVPEIKDWKAVQIGILPRALAFREAPPGDGWRLRREPKATRSLTFRIQMPVGLADRLAEMGWPFGVQLPITWVKEHKILVCKQPGRVAAPKAEGGGA